MVSISRIEINRIMAALYQQDRKMDDAMIRREKALAEGNQKAADACDKMIDLLSYEYRGMEIVIKALGFKFVDDNGFWKIERSKNEDA